MTEDKEVKHFDGEKTKRKRNLWIIAVLFIITIILGGKIYMDKQSEQEQQYKQEKEIAIQAKGMFKDIKSIQVGKRFESSPGTINFNVTIIQDNDEVFNTYITLDDTDFISGKNAIKQQGKTDHPIQVIFSNKKKETLK